MILFLKGLMQAKAIVIFLAFMILGEAAKDYIPDDYRFHAGMVVGILISIIYITATKYSDSFKNKGSSENHRGEVR